MNANRFVESPKEKSDVRSGVRRWLRREVVGILFTAAILFGSAGRLDWVMGWVLVGVYAIWIGALAWILIPTNPELLAERTGPQEGTKRWDTVLLSLLGVAEMVKYIVAGLDLRWAWSPQVSLALQLAGVVVAVLAHAVIGVWSMAANPFFSMTVRIQEDRSHTVATGGPYRYVRHPGYVGTILFHIATPLILGSLWAFIPSGLAALLVIIRTALEDRTLLGELDGYQEYAAQVRYRLLPGIW